MGRRVLVPIVVILTSMTASASAGTSGQLIGTVFDDAGVPLPGVFVSASSPSQIGAVQKTVTGADGSFRFPHLTPGYFTVLAELVGYAPQQLEQVQVRLDHVTGLQIILQQTSFTDQIEVSEETPVVDPVQVSTGQTFASKYIAETSNNWGDLITQTAGTDPSGFRRILGSTPEDNTFLLDGFDATNWLVRFPNPAALYLPFDAVQEVAVHTGGFEAEFGQATGGVVSVISKSGGNSFSGTLDLRYTGSSLETSGEHYDPNEQESEVKQLSATLGGPIVKDRMWFFTSYGRTASLTTATGAPTTEDDLNQNFLGKITWQPGPAWSIVGKYSSTPWVTDNYPSSQFRAPEATAKWTDASAMASLEVVGVLSDATLWSLRLGRKLWDEEGAPSDGDLETIGHYNLFTGETYGNYSQQWYEDTSQSEVSTDLSWFVDGAGTHELKGGLSVGDPAFTEDWCRNGSSRACPVGQEGFYFQDGIDDDNQPIPYQMQVVAVDGPLEYGGQYFAAFLQDAWRLRPNVNLKFGLRWDRVKYDNETGEIADLSKIQPRIGIAWDVGADGRSALRASWGRFMHPATAIMSSYTNEFNAAEYWLSCSTLVTSDAGECADFAGGNDFGYRSDPEGWDPAGWFLVPGNVLWQEPSQVADDLRANYADEWLIGFEREISRRTSVELTYVNKSSKDGFDDTCNGNYPEPTPNSECSHFIVANLPGIRWDYEALMLRLESRALDTLHLLASWVISESKGSMNANNSATGSFDVFPYHFVNRYGYLDDHSRHRVKLNGYWLLPYDFSIAFNGWWDSEWRWTPFDRTVEGMFWGSEFVEPRGSRDGGSLHQLELQFSKGFTVGSTRLVLLGTVINATNAQAGDDICGSVTGCGEFDFGDAIEWQQPRRYEVGFRVEF